MSEPQTNNKPVEATSKPVIKFGGLRERVKNGELDPREVLAWVKEQEYVSENLVKFLQHQIQVGVRGPKKPEPKKVPEAVKKGIEQAKKRQFSKNPPNLDANKKIIGKE